MTTAGAVAVALENVSKTYPNGFHALRGMDLQVEASEWLVLVGPSGCGKTTTLRIIAGLEEPSDGTVRLAGQMANRVPPWRRDVAMVFQRPALAPSHTVRQNLSLGQRRPDGAEALAVAAVLGLSAELDRYPHQLSGGQQQRVALGRALARRTPLYLLDEPLGHLDAPLRDELRRELQVWHQRQPATVVSVTHDPREAWALGQRVAVMDQGKVLQTGSPDEVYTKPCNRFVASFFAQGPVNFFEVLLRSEEKSIQWTVRDWPDLIPAPAGYPAGQEAILGLRAEHVCVGGKASHLMKVTLVERTPRGCWVSGDVHGRRVTGWAETNTAVAMGQTVGIAMDWTKAYVFDRVTGRTLYAPLG
jgi:multiple sugar transport system ATP-binding protein